MEFTVFKFGFYFSRETRHWEKKVEQMSFFLSFSIRRSLRPTNRWQEKMLRKKKSRKKKEHITDSMRNLKCNKDLLFTKIIWRRHAYKVKFEIPWLFQTGGSWLKRWKLSSWCTTNCWRSPRRAGCLQTLEMNSLHWMNIFCFFKLKLINQISQYECILSLLLRVMFWLTFSVSSVCRLIWFLHYFFCDCDPSGLPLMSVCFLSGSWWWRWWNEDTPKNTPEIRTCSMQQDV